MKRLGLLLVGVYLSVAVVALVRERTGSIRCECREDCWCKQPGVSLFRWVFPYGHKLS